MARHAAEQRLRMILVVLLTIATTCVGQTPKTVYGASLGVEQTYGNDSSDTLYATWADDGNLYMTGDDTLGIDLKCRTEGKRHPNRYVFIDVNRVSGDDPRHLTVETVNCMEDYDVPPDSTSDAIDNERATSWKTTGITSVDGVLYLVVEQDTYKDWVNRGRQTAKNATILKSYDHGKTWSGSEGESVKHPMFPGMRFGTPTFLQYGRDGAGGVDGGDRYVYAISNNGSWDNGDALYLGRVSKDNLPKLRGEDWEFYADGQWSHSLGEATPLLHDPNHLSSSSAMYDPGLHMYLLASWYYVGCTGYIAPGCDVHRSRWVWYEAPKPWGPWKPFQRFDWFPAGYYNPVLVNKFLSADGTKDWVFYSGYFWISPYYFFTASPFTLDLAPTHTINDSDKNVEYHGKWVSVRGDMGQYEGDMHYSSDPSASATVHFTGCGVRILTDVGSNRGDMGVYLDGGFEATVSTHYFRPAALQLAQRDVWSTSGLKPGSHVLEIRNHGSPYIAADAFVVIACAAR
jgi:hypothetical protein